MKGTDQVRLGDLCSFLNGGTPSKAVPRYFEGNIPWITGADIISPIVAHARSFITKEAVDNSATNLVSPGTLLLVTRTSVGKVAIAGVDLCFSQDITALIPDSSRLQTAFLLHFLRTQEEYFERASRGATIKGITREVLETLKLPLPSLSEQRRIAEVLDRAEGLRAKRRAALAELDTLTQAIFLEMFGDPAKNPKGWPARALSEIARVERGKFTPRPRNNPSYYGGNFGFIQTGDISNCGGRLTAWTQTLNEKGTTVSRSFPAGTVVIAIVGATLGMTAILETEVYCPDSVVGIEVRPEKASAEYVERVLRWWRPIFLSQAPQTARANINLAMLRPLQIPVPPASIQHTFARRVAAVERLKAAQRKSLEEMDALFASLQHRAFRGEL